MASRLPTSRSLCFVTILWFAQAFSGRTVIPSHSILYSGSMSLNPTRYKRDTLILLSQNIHKSHSQYRHTHYRATFAVVRTAPRIIRHQATNLKHITFLILNANIRNYSSLSPPNITSISSVSARSFSFST